MTRWDDLVAFAGHRVHLVRSREVPRVLDGLGRDLRNARILDVAGGDGYWAGRLRRRGADVVALDVAFDKLDFGRRLRRAPELVRADALALPFRDECFDAVMSACALEHFSNHIQAISEMVRVLRPGGRLAMSVDAITRGNRYPSLFANHEARYHVVRTFDRDTLTSELTNLGLTVDQATYIFRGPNQGIYLVASRLSPSWSWNALAAFAPITAAIDRLSRDDNGAILLVNTTKTPT